MNDELMYLKATEEFERNELDLALWAKSMALSEGDTTKAKYKYINLRVAQLITVEENNAQVKPITGSKDSKHKISIKPEKNKSKGIKEQLTRDKVYDKKKEKLPKTILNESFNLGFGWWKTWALLNLTIGNMVGIYAAISYPYIWIELLLSTVLMILVLKYNKYAFLIATILSLNPIIWSINGFYLNKRWNHPRLNKINHSINSDNLKDTIINEKVESKTDKIKSITSFFIQSNQLDENQVNNLYKNLLDPDKYNKVLDLVSTFGSFSTIVQKYW